jgi:hypothetical protein
LLRSPSFGSYPSPSTDLLLSVFFAIIPSEVFVKLLNLKSIARIDFMLVGEIPYVIEVNTTPGFSTESIVPKMLAEAGISITSFWETIIETELILS